MALKRNERYPGRFQNPSTGQPQGAFKNRTSPTAQDGSYLEADWANDWSGFFSSLLSGANIAPNGSVDAVGSSQYFNALLSLFLRPGNSLSEIATAGTQSAARGNLGLGTGSTLAAPTGLISGSGYLRIPAIIGGNVFNFYFQWKTVTINQASEPNMATTTSTWPVAFPNTNFITMGTLANVATYLTNGPGSAIVSAFSINNSQFTAACGYTRSPSTVHVFGVGY